MVIFLFCFGFVLFGFPQYFLNMQKYNLKSEEYENIFKSLRIEHKLLIAGVNAVKICLD